MRRVCRVSIWNPGTPLAPWVPATWASMCLTRANSSSWRAWSSTSWFCSRCSRARVSTRQPSSAGSKLLGMNSRTPASRPSLKKPGWRVLVNSSTGIMRCREASRISRASSTPSSPGRSMSVSRRSVPRCRNSVMAWRPSRTGVRLWPRGSRAAATAVWSAGSFTATRIRMAGQARIWKSFPNCTTFRMVITQGEGRRRAMLIPLVSAFSRSTSSMPRELESM